MALQKSSLNINFSKGLDLKTDPLQVAPGNFLSLENTVFNKAGLLQKRNGFGPQVTLPDTTSTFLTTFNGNLTAIGTSFNALSDASDQWINKGTIDPLDVSTLPLIRNNLNQKNADIAISESGLICTTYAETNGSTTLYYYAIADRITGQNVVAPTRLPSVGTITPPPRAFLLGRFFIIIFSDNFGGVDHIKYLAIDTAVPTIVNPPIDVTTQTNSTTRGYFDAVVASDTLYIVWNGSGNDIKMRFLTSTLILSTVKSIAGQQALTISITPDITGVSLILYISWVAAAGGAIKVASVDSVMNPVLGAGIAVASTTAVNITSTAQNGSVTVVYESTNAYTYDPTIPTNFISKVNVTSLGVVSGAAVLTRSVGLASKAFLYNEASYFLAIYLSSYQPTYFLINSIGNVVAKIAYQNGPSTYYVNGLPNAVVEDNVASFPYLFKDLIQAVNKDTDVAAGSQTAGIYSQTGINLGTVTFGTENLTTAEIGNNLLASGGFIRMFDGYLPVEQNFFVYPDSIEVTTSPTGGSLIAQQYFYQVTYEWTDNQGNPFRSAPSVPVSVTATTGASSNTINIPTLRLTYKTSNPVKIVIYRWSTAQQIYYQVTSISSPLLNDTTIDSVSYTDTLSDTAILGNNIIYTNGGVIENIAPPAASVMTLFQSRLFIVDAEDKNLLWFSKQVIPGVPVEMSDLLTIFVAPTTAAQGSTGPITALSALDDKLIIFKQNAIYYINGIGPDNTGNNNQFSEPVFITSTVGCVNGKSIVFMPNGLMFQSDKGIWLLGRDLSTTYIGSPVETYNTAEVLSALNIPATNQVRFTLNTGITLMYDYFYGQWGSFVGIPGISSTLYQSLHTYVNEAGEVFQETPGRYLDKTRPVLISFITGWMNLAGIQGLERAYSFFMIGQYISPHRLQVQMAYDYANGPSQTVYITPDNYSLPWGGEQLWGSGAYWGGQPTLEQWQVYFNQQKVQSFQISIQEVFDPSFDTVPGAGLTISGITLVVGAKKGNPTLKASRSVG